MKYATVDLLACPMCKHHPLKLKIFKEYKTSIERSLTKKLEPFCKTYCALHDKPVNNLQAITDCKECLSRDIVLGLLVCPKCGEHYPIILGVPIMYPRYLKRTFYVEMLYKYFDKYLRFK